MPVHEPEELTSDGEEVKACETKRFRTFLWPCVAATATAESMASFPPSFPLAKATSISTVGSSSPLAGFLVWKKLCTKFSSPPAPPRPHEHPLLVPVGHLEVPAAAHDEVAHARDLARAEAEEAAEGAVLLEHLLLIEAEAEDGVDVLEVGVAADEEGAVLLESDGVLGKDEVVFVVDFANHLKA